MNGVILTVLVFALVSVTSASYCQPPPVVDNGHHNGGSQSQFQTGHVLTYSCDEGYQLEGEKEIECIFDKTHYWNKEPPECLRK